MIVRMKYMTYDARSIRFIFKNSTLFYLFIIIIIFFLRFYIKQVLLVFSLFTVGRMIMKKDMVQTLSGWTAFILNRKLIEWPSQIDLKLEKQQILSTVWPWNTTLEIR